jgi:NDP-sugar pyrophosphorylase family protein
MKAMIFAAGLGTRLYPLTKDIPKALVKIHDKTLLEILINKLKHYGFIDLIINVHHFANQISDFLESSKNFDIRITLSDESVQLLDTGGGLKKASWFFDDEQPFLLHNVDILSNIDLFEMINDHQKSGALISLAVMNRKTSRKLLFNQDGQLRGWQNLITGEQILVHNETDLVPLAFSGVHVINPGIFSLMSESGKFSLIDLYLRLAESEKITWFRHDNSWWTDAGKPENIAKAEEVPYRIIRGF